MASFTGEQSPTVSLYGAGAASFWNLPESNRGRLSKRNRCKNEDKEYDRTDTDYFPRESYVGDVIQRGRVPEAAQQDEEGPYKPINRTQEGADNEQQKYNHVSQAMGQPAEDGVGSMTAIKLARWQKI